MMQCMKNDEAIPMEKYCDRCDRKVKTKIVTKKEIYEVRGETIEVEAQVLVCAECGEEFFCERLDNKTLLSVYAEYRKGHSLLFPSK